MEVLREVAASASYDVWVVIALNSDLEMMNSSFVPACRMVGAAVGRPWMLVGAEASREF